MGEDLTEGRVDDGRDVDRGLDKEPAGSLEIVPAFPPRVRALLAAAALASLIRRYLAIVVELLWPVRFTISSSLRPASIILFTVGVLQALKNDL